MSDSPDGPVAEALARLDREVEAGDVDLVGYWRRRAAIEAGEQAPASRFRRGRTDRPDGRAVQPPPGARARPTPAPGEAAAGIEAPGSAAAYRTGDPGAAAGGRSVPTGYSTGAPSLVPGAPPPRAAAPTSEPEDVSAAGTDPPERPRPRAGDRAPSPSPFAPPDGAVTLARPGGEADRQPKPGRWRRRRR